MLEYEPSVRKQHNAGYKHKANVRNYYQQFEEQQTQSLIDQKIKEHITGQAAFGQIGAAYAGWRPGVVRPPILPAPLPIPGAVPPAAPMAPGVRPPVLPRPAGVPVYGTAPITPPIPGQPGVATAVVTANGQPGQPVMAAPTSAPGPTAPAPNGAPPTSSQPMYQAIPGGGFAGNNVPTVSSFSPTSGTAVYPATSAAESCTYVQVPNNNHQSQ